MPSPVRLLCCWLVAAGCASGASAQTLSGFNSISATQERLTENHWRLVGNVALEDKDTKLFADQIDIFVDEDRAVAVGNVVFTQGKSRIAADKADFNTKTRLGTFHGASGIASVQPPMRSSGVGMFAPPLSTQQTDVYFFGESVEKIGPKKYKITNGGFSTCVQPTPRWDMHADTVVLNIDHYTLLRNAVLNVKGVPMFYLPVLYYPTKEEGRATGFLLPTYGVTSLRGQAIHNAFFWAISRSQDATLMHDWYSKAGQGFGGEYRYDFGGGSDGAINALLLNQKATLGPSGQVALPASNPYFVRSAATQILPGNLRARFNADYYSSVNTMQSFNTNIYDATRNSRSFGANVVGAWRTFSLNGTYDRTEFFGSPTSSWLQGSTPRVALARNERPLFRNSPVYLSATSEFANIDRQSREDGVVGTDDSLMRVDLSPQIRYPFKKWQWFTVNSVISWRDTFYSRSHSLTPTGAKGPVEDRSLNRQYYTMLAQAVGPVFNRIWNTPDNGYAEKFKHTVEPFVNVQRTSNIENVNRFVQIDGFDAIVGNTTNFTYGVNNRFYAKKRPVNGRPSASMEILSVELVQTYYTSPLASQFDMRYQTSFNQGAPSNFSPLQLSVRATPTPAINATLRGEIDSRHSELRTLSANTNYNWASRIQSQVAWTKTFFIKELPGFNDKNSLYHMLNLSTNVHTQDNRVGVMHSFNYDILQGGVMQQRISAFYNAQCCGISFEHQTYNWAGFGFPPDRRFFLSFTLAGLGNFSPFNGAMGGMPR